MMNQRTILTGRLRGLSPIGWPEIWSNTVAWFSFVLLIVPVSRGAKATTILTMPLSISALVVVVASHLTWKASPGTVP